MVTDEGLEPNGVSPLNQREKRLTGFSAGPNLTFGELMKRLINRWDSMSDEQKRAFEFLADWEEELEMADQAECV